MSNRFEYDELIYKGRVAQVHRVGVRTPGGEVLQRDWIHYGGAAVILPLLSDGRIILIRNVRFAVNETLWELPAGMLDGDEAPQVGARRELEEETGYTAGRLEKLGAFYSAPGSSDEMLHAFVARDLVGGPQKLEKYEEITVEALPDDTVRQMVLDGTIHDAKTISTLALYWLGKGR